jgi:diguanylate cyclase (GGDEF)-like protein
MDILTKLENKSALFWMIVGCLILSGIGIADIVTGRELSFSLFYLIPIVLVAWFSGRIPGLVISIFGATTWFIADALSGESYSLPIIRYWNAVIRLGFFVIVTLLLPTLKELAHEKEIARIDYLTGAANRRCFFEAAQTELNRSQRYKRPFTIAYIDLDSFKAVNDKAGHKTGDKILHAFVKRAKVNLRKTDILARMGGDEFVLLLPEADEDAAQIVVPKIQLALLDEMRRNNFPITFSIGVLTYREGPITPDELIMKADNLMYSVKKNGKNAISYAIYGDLTPLPPQPDGSAS